MSLLQPGKQCYCTIVFINVLYPNKHLHIYLLMLQFVSVQVLQVIYVHYTYTQLDKNKCEGIIIQVTKFDNRLIDILLRHEIYSLLCDGINLC